MEEDEKKIELFETMPIPKAVAKLSIPTVLSTLVMVIYSLADTYFVGLLNIPKEAAAVTLAAPVILAFNAINNLFGIGTSSFMSRSLGKRDYDTVRRTSAFGFYCAAGSALFLSLICAVFNSPLLSLLGAEGETFEPTRKYLFWTVILGAAPSILNIVLSFMVKAEGSALHASIGIMSGCLLNIALDPVFILPWGLNMGASGAGCATFISNCVACTYFFVLITVKRKKTYVCLNPKMFSFRKDIAKSVFTVGVPAAIQNLLNVTGMTVLNNFTAQFETAAVAAMGITHKINMVPMYISMGVGDGILPLVGYNYASGNSKRMKKAIVFAGKISVAFVIFAAVMYYAFAGNVVSFFMKDADIVSYGTAFLRGFCLGLPFFSLDFLAVGIFEAVGMGRESLIFAVLRKVVLEIPAMYILNRIYPLYGLSYSQLCAEVVLAAAAVIVLSRLFKRVERKSENKQA